MGALIKDEHYTPALEGHLCRKTPVLEALKASGIECDVSFLRGLQAIHDDYEVEDWDAKFSWFASSYKLQYKDEVIRRRHGD